MPFPAKHYVPALKLKAAEKDALSVLAPSVKKGITPLLQVVENPQSKPLQKHIETAFKKIEGAVSGLARYFIDPVEIADSGKNGADLTFKKCSGLSVPYTPVAGPSRPVDLTLAALQAVNRTGLAVRITRKEFESGTLASSVSKFLATHSLNPASLDLIVDLGAVDSMIADGVVALTEAFLAAV
ncbi:MAG: hypothetical protein JNG84_11270, partial [Archangium sp.]|nr:hypothetical protein [Archangium sp.]